MAQYKTGTVAVTNGSEIVTGTGTAWLTNLQPGDGFTVTSTGVAYDVAQVVSDTELKLSAPYASATGSGLAYAAWRDFTAPDGIPEMSQGDIETATVFTRAMRKIQQRFNLPGDVAEEARDIALASANFKGRWGDLTGSVSVPASVYHDGYYWILLDNLADVTAHEPGESASWGRLYDGNPLAYGPGPQSLIAGDMTDGFFGEVSSGELFSGDDLALILGVTEGVAQNSDAGWLKFACDNKILFVAKQSFRHSISWDHIYSRGLVYGTDDNGENPRGTPTNQYTTVERSGNQFAVRLLAGGNADPVDVSDPKFFTDEMVDLDLGAGSEWNRLMYRVHQDVPTSDGTDGMRKDRHGGPQVGENWANYSNAELNNTGNGRASWCQETTTDYSSSRVLRGIADVAYFYRISASDTISGYGWRPALELITNN